MLKSKILCFEFANNLLIGRRVCSELNCDWGYLLVRYSAETNRWQPRMVLIANVPWNCSLLEKGDEASDIVSNCFNLRMMMSRQTSTENVSQCTGSGSMIQSIYRMVLFEAWKNGRRDDK